MGTSCNLVIIKDEQILVDKHIKFDGYWGYEGKRVHEFLKTANLDEFFNKVETNTEYSSKEEMDAIVVEEGGFIDNTNGWILFGSGGSAQFASKYSGLSDAAGSIEFINEIMTSPNKVKQAIFNVEAQWEYIIDISKNTFSIKKYGDIIATVSLDEISDFDLEGNT